MRAGGWVWLIAPLLLTGCGGSSLESDDPAGYKACQAFAEAVVVTDDPLARVGGMFEAGELAREASTEEIRGAVEQVGSDWLPNDADMREACESNGVEIR